MGVASVFPNPAHSRAMVRFSLSEGSPDVRVELFDVAGRRVRTLASGAFPAGSHEINWERGASGGQPIRSGVYFVRISTKGHLLTNKIVISDR
ncbi:MAG: T9SS type A sorting domain-containing protein [Candidatus Eisenbacteria bacterium]|nr:T9SS type A sorting domain-containing protein [Candidatus Eisenbacteria bacterium]